MIKAETLKKKVSKEKTLKSKKSEMSEIKLIRKQNSSESSFDSSDSDKEEDQVYNTEKVLSKEDIALIFEPIIIDPLILSNKRVKRTRDGF